MKKIRQALRLVKINYVLAKYGLDRLSSEIHLLRPLRFLSYANPWNWFRGQKFNQAQALRLALEELGPIFIKFGQALSTRPDILPLDLAAELSKLQDNVPPFSEAEVLAQMQAIYGQSPWELFAEFDAQALASASVAQVHAARLKTGEAVVVKLLRPNIRKIIEEDIGILRMLAKLAERYWGESRRFKPLAIVEEFEQHLYDELDLQREAANASQLRRNFKQSPDLYVPEIYWPYVRESVLVSERIYGIPVTDMEALRTEGVNIKKLAERGVEIFFTQVFRDCFFHADMHPGNIFVSYERPEDPQYICVDFGIIGSLNETDKRYLADNLLAFFHRDYRRVAELHIESGWVAADTRAADFENAIRTVCEPIFERPMKEISFAQLVLQLFRVARRFKMEVQPQLILLQKTLFAIEGLGRQLYPDLDLWTTAKPFLERWLKEQLGFKAFFRNLKMNLPFVVEQLPHMPRLINELLLLEKQRAQKALQETEAVAPSKPKLRALPMLFLGIFLASTGILLFQNAPVFQNPDSLLYLSLGSALLAVLSRISKS